MRAHFRVPRSAVEIAGGYIGMNDILASRLTGFLAERAPHFEVHQGELIVAAFNGVENGHHLIMLSAMRAAPGDAHVCYELECLDLTRGVEPYADLLPAPDPDSLRELFIALRALIGDWPEVVPAQPGLAA